MFGARFFEWRLRFLDVSFLDRLKLDVIQFRNRSMSDPSLSDIDFKNEMACV